MQRLRHSIPRPRKLAMGKLRCISPPLVARYSSTFSSLCCVSNNATNSHDTINDNHYKSATGDTVQLEMKCMQKGAPLGRSGSLEVLRYICQCLGAVAQMPCWNGLQGRGLATSGQGSTHNIRFPKINKATTQQTDSLDKSNDKN